MREKKRARKYVDKMTFVGLPDAITREELVKAREFDYNKQTYRLERNG